MKSYREFLNESWSKAQRQLGDKVNKFIRSRDINYDHQSTNVKLIANKDERQALYDGDESLWYVIIHKNGDFVAALKDWPRRVFFDETKHGEEYELDEFVGLIKPDSKLFLVKGGDAGTGYRKHREREKTKIAISAAKENRVPLNYLLLLTKELQRGMVLGVFGKHRLDSYSVAIGSILGGYYDIYYPVEDKYEPLWKEAMLLRNDLIKELSDEYGFASSKGVRHETVSRVVKYYKNLRKELGIK